MMGQDQYVDRNFEGKIVATYGAEQYPDQESLLADDPELITFFNPPPPPVDSVTARQFKLQLLSEGIIDQVEAWVGSQDRATQIAYEYSGTFVKSEPMMQAGFVALGFTDIQRDDFFQAASKR